MIIKGKSRGSARELVAHLRRLDTNEHMEVVQIRGTVADDLPGALAELAAVAAGTRCKRPLYHAALNTRIEEYLTRDQWLFAVDELEARLGLTGQPRTVVMHVKEGRAHIHCVWSRIDTARMCAIPDSHNYRIHEETARALEQQFGHASVQGAFTDREGASRPARTPRTWELQQAARTGTDLEALSAQITALWNSADTSKAFVAALRENGIVLALGSRRQFVIVDASGAVHSLARRIAGADAASVRARLQDLDLDTLPPVGVARAVQLELQSVPIVQSTADEPDAITLARDPRPVFDQLLKTRSFATEGEIRHALAEQMPHGIDMTFRQLLAAPDIVALHEPETHSVIGYTTLAIRAEEQALVTLAVRLSRRSGAAVPETCIAEVVTRHGLDEEQAAAVRHALSGHRLVLIEGRAGTGKSAVLTAIRAAVEAQTRPVIGLAPTNGVADDMRASGFTRAATVHSLLWYRAHVPEHANAQIPRSALIAVDEAAMLDVQRYRELLEAVEAAKATLCLVGDDRQLPAIERGGLFTDLVRAVGSVELQTVRRQERHWARAAARALSEGRFRDALEAYAERGLVQWSAGLEQARAALVARYAQDTIDARGRRFVFCYTNEEVKRLNDALQAIEVERGRVGSLQIFETEQGTVRLGTGDRLSFRGTDKRRGVLNGALATVEHIQGDMISVLTDAGRRITFDAREFSQFDLGYAGTIYRGQGKTLDETYVLHTRHWRDASTYVALTRSRGETHLFVARSEAKNLTELTAQVSRQSHRGSSLGYFTAAELHQVTQTEHAPTKRSARGYSDTRLQEE